MCTGAEYNNNTDEELILRLRRGEEDIMDYLLNKYKNLVRSQAKSFYLKGADEQDLLQEGMIGLFKAIRDYDEKKDASFATFAKLCVSRNVCSAVERANRKKQEPLNSFVSLESSAEEEGYSEGNNYSEAAMRRLGMDDPEFILIDRESTDRLKSDLIRELSPMERKVFELLLSGFDYVQIAGALNREPKSVDNAITRIRGKAKRICG
ncbi:MAG: sigma-70 family RNA polymerase sigma factor [Lachnospiraceae bacterium]|nr:sigma-70 family RNA polymerase sigma factor [Lachnospiraceae bacterium]